MKIEMSKRKFYFFFGDPFLLHTKNLSALMLKGFLNVLIMNELLPAEKIFLVREKRQIFASKYNA